MKVGDITSVSVEDFVRLAPRGLVLNHRGHTYKYTNGHYIVEGMVLQGFWRRFDNTNNYRNPDVPYLDENASGAITNVMFTVIKLPVSVRRK